MKLVEALQRVQKASAGAPFRVQLGCGFTPLHLATFLGAHVALRLPDRKPVVELGVYGDATSAFAGEAEAAVLVLEWPDLDPRLGLRRVGGWSPSVFPDVLATAGRSLDRIRAEVERVAKLRPIAVALPSLPLAPIDHHVNAQMGSLELGLLERVAAFGHAISDIARVLHPRGLASDRHDVGQEIATGFPYTLSHTDALAQQLALLLVPAQAKKGLITDLDNTLWRGILGDVGPSGITWDLDHGSHMHAVYQQLLLALADSGVLIAVASKNDPELVDEAFARPELAGLRAKLSPIVASWDPKSKSIQGILQAWNIGAGDVVVIDDSPMELAEIQSAFPAIEAIAYPADDDAKALALAWRLRDLFGKERISAEDALRGASLASTTAIANATDPDAFLADLGATVTFDFEIANPPPRALELVNKTNQFNANGRRWTEGDWAAYLRKPDAVLVQVAYADKFGPLGTIGVLAGQKIGDALAVGSWVLSCRAFSRRVEHQMLASLFRMTGAKAIELDFQATPRNGPLRTFLREVLGAEPSGTPVRIERDRFLAVCPPLPHTIAGLP